MYILEKGAIPIRSTLLCFIIADLNTIENECALIRVLKMQAAK